MPTYLTILIHFTKPKNCAQRFNITTIGKVEFDFEGSEFVWTVSDTNEQECPTLNSGDRQFDNAIAPQTTRTCEFDLIE